MAIIWNNIARRNLNKIILRARPHNSILSSMHHPATVSEGGTFKVDFFIILYGGEFFGLEVGSYLGLI